tara:strand:- start:193 stop:450 length:258 start_codon:yes stop_codon:yes gene_type:complete
MTTDDLRLDRLDERAFFIKDKTLRQNVKDMCEFAFSIGCATLHALRPHLSSMGADYTLFVAEVNNRQHDELFLKTAEKTLWSENE